MMEMMSIHQEVMLKGHVTWTAAGLVDFSPLDWTTSSVVWVVQQLIWLGTQSTGVWLSLLESARVQPEYVRKR